MRRTIMPAPRYASAGLTDWFPATTRPASPGVYERQVRLAPYSYWDGEQWNMSAQTPRRAAAFFGCASLKQDASWRGLTGIAALAALRKPQP